MHCHSHEIVSGQIESHNVISESCAAIWTSLWFQAGYQFVFVWFVISFPKEGSDHFIWNLLKTDTAPAACSADELSQTHTMLDQLS